MVHNLSTFKTYYNKFNHNVSISYMKLKEIIRTPNYKSIKHPFQLFKHIIINTLLNLDVNSTIVQT